MDIHVVYTAKLIILDLLLLIQHHMHHVNIKKGCSAQGWATYNAMYFFLITGVGGTCRQMAKCWWKKPFSESISWVLLYMTLFYVWIHEFWTKYSVFYPEITEVKFVLIAHLVGYCCTLLGSTGFCSSEKVTFVRKKLFSVRMFSLWNT